MNYLIVLYKLTYVKTITKNYTASIVFFGGKTWPYCVNCQCYYLYIIMKPPTWFINGVNWFLIFRIFPKEFSINEGKDSSLRVCPVGAVSKTTTSKSICFTNLWWGKGIHWWDLVIWRCTVQRTKQNKI